MNRNTAILLTAVLAAVVILDAAKTIHASDEKKSETAEPTYTDSGQLIRPEGYRRWIVVGASIGLSYFGKEPPPDGPGAFHRVYMHPKTYDHYVSTGAFPDKTMLVMENYSAGNKETDDGTVGTEFDILHGYYEDEMVGMEVALKDGERFEDTWAYYNFTAGKGKPLKETAAPFPKAVCWNCHNTHGGDDNVFVQFYPVLREELQKRLNKSTE